MDYFSELLNSYTKLKKRTFKLTYINEQAENPAFQELKQILMQASEIESPIQSEQYPGLSNFKYKKTKNGGVTVLTGHTQMTILDPQGNLETLNAKGKPLNKKAQDEILNAMYDAMRGEVDKKNENPELKADELVRQQQAAAEQQRLAQFEKIGGALELAGKDLNQFKKFIASQQRIDGYLRNKVCINLPKDIDPNSSIKRVCDSIGTFTGGKSSGGWEYKLANSKTTIIDKDTGQLTEKELEVGLINDAAENHADLIAFMAGEGDCATIANKIGFFKDKLVIFGSEKNEGLAIRPNALQQGAIESVKKQCGDIDFTEIVREEVNQKELNAVKGTMFELTAQTAVKLLAAKTPEQKTLAFRDLVLKVHEKRLLLRQYSSSLPPQEMEGAYDLDTVIERDKLLEHLGIANDIPSLQKFLSGELRSALQVFQTLGAEDAIATGKTSTTGGREDLKLVYSDEISARSAAEQIGSEVVFDKELGKFTVGIGQKRYTQLEAIKAGEINSTSRLNGLVLGEITIDSRLEAGFTSKISKMQFGSQATKEQTSAENYFRALEAKIEKTTEPLSTHKVYIDAAGKIKSISPEDTIKNIAKVVKGLLSYDDLKMSSLGKALFSGKNSDYKNFDDPETQKRIKEVIQREARFKQYKEDIEAGKPEARDALLRMALVCGANTRNMSQIITEDSGRSYVISHNEVFDAVCKSNREGTLQIEIEGTTAVFTTPEGLSFKFSQEGTWGGSERNTRSLVKISKETVQKLNRPMRKISQQPEPVNADTLQKFLYGQMKLLEELLKITR